MLQNANIYKGNIPPAHDITAPKILRTYTKIYISQLPQPYNIMEIHWLNNVAIS